MHTMFGCSSSDYFTFVSDLSLQALFAGEDPDVPVGEKDAEGGRGSPGRRSGQKSGLTDRDAEADENWDKDDRARDRGHESGKAGGSTVAARFEDKDITDLKMVSNVYVTTVIGSCHNY